MATDQPAAFGDLLRRRRVSAGLTQEALAEQARLSVRAVSDIERGLHRSPRRETVELLAEALRLTPAERTVLAAAARRPGVPAAARSAVPAAPISTLPAPPTALVGREREARALAALLSAPEARLVTLTGPGGVGKTRLALHVAAQLEGEFAHRARFVALAAISDPSLVASTLAQTFGIALESGRPHTASLVEFLRGRELLLLLDNFEQLTAAAGLVGDLLAHCPRLKLLVTSREALRLRAEREFPVPPLELPALERPASLDLFMQNAAVGLFARRAQDIRPDFVVTLESAPAVAEICHRLDGLPLAIELAAARTRVLTPQMLLALLAGVEHGSPLRLLTGGPRDLPARQQTLRSTIAWSYDLLDEGERLAFRRLSVFPGGWTLAAAEHVCAGDGIAGFDVLDLLGRLADKSLLLAEPRGGSLRYRMLETIREFACEQLETSGEAAAVRGRQRDWCLTLAEAPAPAWGGMAQVAWAAQLECEHDNFRAALACCEAEGTQGIVPWLRLGAALAPFWYARGYVLEGRAWLGRALDAGVEAAAALRAPALAQAGRLAFIRGDFEQGAAWLEEGLSLYRARGDRRGMAWTLSALGALLELQGDRARVTELLSESLALYRELGDQPGIADSLNKLGFTAWFQGDLERAAAVCEEALFIYRAHDDHEGMAAALLTIARAAMIQRDFPRAAGLYDEALRLSREAAEKKSLPNVLVEAGMLLARLGEYERAAAYQRESLTLNRERGALYGMYSALGVLGSTLLGLGQPERAARLVAAAEQLRLAIGASRPDAYAPLHERLLLSLRNRLGDEAFAEAWAAGEALSLESAIAEALDDAG